MNKPKRIGNYGHKLTEETKNKLRLANLGKKHSEETKKKMSNSHKGKNTWSKGRKWSEENKAKLKGKKAWNKGKKFLNLRGENSPSWKGGVTRKHSMLRSSVQYYEWRQQILERDNYTCVVCKKRGGKLHVDHIKAFSSFPLLRFDLNNGRVLCIPCHRKTDNYGGKKPKIINNVNNGN